TATEGSHTLRWDFDYLNQVVETNEQNNSVSDAFIVQGFDIQADRAFLRTAPGGGGSEVLTPAIGDTVYFNVDWSASGSSGARTVSTRALIDGSIQCSGSLTATPPTV